MAASTVVRARIDEQTKEAAAVLSVRLKIQSKRVASFLIYA